MKIFLDSSDVDEIREAVDTGLIDGVTTNPTLMLRAGRNPSDVLAEITELFPWTASVSAEVSGETWEDMLEMADDYIQIAPNITIKVPCNVQGLKACKNLLTMTLLLMSRWYSLLLRRSLLLRQVLHMCHLSWVDAMTIVSVVWS